jgi:methylmalonyl-CoA/ethylmalonyl-CoA epimerase
MKKKIQNKLVLHHLGCATESIEESKKIYVNNFGFSNVSETYIISKQNVKVCFIETAPGVYIEFVEAISNNPFLTKILKSKNTFYHTGYFSNNLDADLENLIESNCYLVNRFESEAFGNRECAFLYTEEMHLIELIQTTFL